MISIEGFCLYSDHDVLLRQASWRTISQPKGVSREESGQRPGLAWDLVARRREKQASPGPLLELNEANF